jgi:isopenicillin-N N-acyltransferase-like protein
MSRMPLIEVAGPPRERGRQHGEQAREAIERSIAWYSEQFTATASLGWDVILENARRWEPLVEAYLPEALEEMQGIAEGSGRTYEEILALNGRGELSSGNPFLDDAAEGCSSYSILPEAAGDGHAYCGQNWDWRSAILDTVVMLRIEQPGLPTIVMQVRARTRPALA